MLKLQAGCSECDSPVNRKVSEQQPLAVDHVALAPPHTVVHAATARTREKLILHHARLHLSCEKGTVRRSIG